MDVAKISGGERRRVALCRLLLSRPDMFLLDEPTNHLDAESVAWLERYLKEYPGTVVAITHDRYFLDNVAGWILELDRGHGIPGGQLLLLARAEARAARPRQVTRQRTLARELDGSRWRARASGEEQLGAAAGLRCAAQRVVRAARRRARDRHPAGTRLGDLVVEATDVRKGTETGR